MRALLAFFILVFALMSQAALGQTFIPAAPGAADCQLPNGQKLLFMENGWVTALPGNFFNKAEPWVDGVKYHRDPSGTTYWRLDPGTKGKPYAVGWNGELFDTSGTKPWDAIGICAVLRPFRPLEPARVPPYAANWDFNPGNGFLTPMIVAEAEVKACKTANPSDSEAFAACVVKRMAGEQEGRFFDCVNSSGDPVKQAICGVAAFGGNDEQQVAQALSQCYDQHGSDFSSYPLCTATGKLSADQQRLIRCIREQSEQNGQVTLLGTAMCYGSDEVKLNAEAQIAVQCAVFTNGEPYKFAACTGGLLTKAELEKCETNGIGGPNGCFGPNNTIVQYLQGLGTQLPYIYGPLNPLIKKWNDAVNQVNVNVTRESLKALRDVGNAINKEPTAAAVALAKQAREVLPQFRMAKPSLTVGKVKIKL